MFLSRLCIAASLCLLCSSSLPGQAVGTTPPRPGVSVGASGTVPPPGDPAVLYMFLRYQESIVQDVQSAAATNAAAGEAKQQAVAQSFGVSTSDFARINPVYQGLATALRVIDTEANAYRDAVVAESRPSTRR
jgi:hypothetical protein